MITGILGLIHLILWVYAVIQILGSDASFGSKILWILIVFFLPLIGLILWFLIGPKRLQTA